MPAGPTVNEQESEFVYSVLGNNLEIAYTSIARLYHAANGKWHYSKKMGAAAIVTDKVGNHIKIVDLKTRQVCFDLPIHVGLDYNRPRAFFHTFETDDSVAGLSFASEEEAQQFYLIVVDLLQNNPLPRPSPTKLNSRIDDTPTRSNTRAQYNTAPNLSTRQNEKVTAPLSQSEDLGSTRKPAASTYSSSTMRETRSRPSNGSYSKGSTFSSLRDRKKKKRGDLEISEPSNFRHESSIGYNPKEGTFEIRNIPPEWRALFKAANIKPRDFKDRETVAMIMGIVNQETGGKGFQKPPPPPPADTQKRPPPANTQKRSPPLQNQREGPGTLRVPPISLPRESAAAPQVSPRNLAPPQTSPRNLAPPQTSPRNPAPAQQISPRNLGPPQVSPRNLAPPPISPRDATPPQTSPRNLPQTSPRTLAPPAPQNSAPQAPRNLPQTEAPPVSPRGPILPAPPGNRDQVSPRLALPPAPPAPNKQAPAPPRPPISPREPPISPRQPSPRSWNSEVDDYAAHQTENDYYENNDGYSEEYSSNAPPPPAPPPVVSAGGGLNLKDALLAKQKSLTPADQRKPVEAERVNLPGQPKSLTETLMDAMNARREAIREDVRESDNDDDDADWDDF